MHTSAHPRPASHTPGPWTWDGYSLRPADPDPDHHAVHTIIEAEAVGWGFVAAEPIETRAESRANLTLIAATPELLEAAHAAEAVLGKQKWLEGSTDPEAVALYKLRAAIAKATGGTQP
jgi:hypothetical protein